uniref:Partial AB-hydrolase lipase domain-containing protein n=1 Tax=Timema cristinae TaxID=61476 RepID=A0A7R9CRK1_TIMCR|nr:unnamed protein product [Timema cristinae]
MEWASFLCENGSFHSSLEIIFRLTAVLKQPTQSSPLLWEEAHSTPVTLLTYNQPGLSTVNYTRGIVGIFELWEDSRLGGRVSSLGLVRTEYNIIQTSRFKKFFDTPTCASRRDHASVPDRDSNPDIPVFGKLVQHESRALDHVSTEPEIIKKNGYPVEVHHVTTEDGYIVTLHRLPRHMSEKAPTLVQHGIFHSSADSIISGPKSVNQVIVIVVKNKIKQFGELRLCSGYFVCPRVASFVFGVSRLSSGSLVCVRGVSSVLG